jgi:hypothetical protein
MAKRRNISYISCTVHPKKRKKNKIARWMD